MPIKSWSLSHGNRRPSCGPSPARLAGPWITGYEQKLRAIVSVVQDDALIALKLKADLTAIRHLDGADPGQAPAQDSMHGSDISVWIAVIPVFTRRVRDRYGLPEDHTGIDKKSMPHTILELKKHHIRLGDLLALIPVFLDDEA